MKLDGRKLKHTTLEEIRIRAVQQVERGESPEKVIQALGFTRQRIYEWMARYREGGIEALKAKPIAGCPPKFAAQHIKKLYGIIVDNNPLQLKFEFALWTREMVRELIQDRFNVRMSAVSVGRLLKKMGLTPQRPLRKAYQQNPKAVEQWIEQEYPRIQAQALREKALIFFGDEASINSDYHSGTTWAPRGKTPVVEATGKRFKINLISAVSPKGYLRFMATGTKFKAEIFCEFLKRLIHNVNNPVYLIVDQHPVHRSKVVKKFIQSTEGRLKLFYLPAYSPELNPDELVWNHVKHHRIGRMIITEIDNLQKRVLGILRSLQKQPAKVSKFFHHPKLLYCKAMSGYLCTP